MIIDLVKQHFKYFTQDVYEKINRIPEIEQEKIVQKIQKARHKAIILNTITTCHFTFPSKHVELLDYMVEVLARSTAKTKLQHIRSFRIPHRDPICINLNHAINKHSALLNMAMSKQNHNIILYIINNHEELENITIPTEEKYIRIIKMMQLLPTNSEEHAVL